MNNAYIFILISLIVGLALMRVPIYLALLVGTLYLQVFVNQIPLAGTFNALVETIAKSSLLCIPFFILAGNLMSSSSLGDRLVNLFVTMFKRFRGGFAISALLSNAFFGAISGSSPAAVATFGHIIYKPMEKLYGAKTALGILTSSGALSIIIPPSITLIIYGIATNTSIARLFMAGFLPGVLIVGIVSIYLTFTCKQNTDEEIKSVTGDHKTISRAMFESAPVMVLPVIILGGIYGGVFTPTEAGAVAALYACLASLALKDFTLKSLPGIIMHTCKTSAQLMVIIAASCAFAQAAIIAQLPRAVSMLFEGASKFEFLMILNIVLLLVGCLFETGSAILILAPLILPTAIEMGIDPVHLGIVFTVNLAIGMFTPPFGLNIFVVHGILGKGIGEISIASIPYIILYFAACLIITYVPWISLFFPKLLM